LKAKSKTNSRSKPKLKTIQPGQLTLEEFEAYAVESLALSRSITDLLKLMANGSPYPNSEEAQKVIATSRETINNQAEQIGNLTKQRDSAREALEANIQNLGESRALVLQLTEKLGFVTTEHDKMAGQLMTARRRLGERSGIFGQEG